MKLEDRETVVRTINELTDALFWSGSLQEATETARRGLNYLPADISAERARLLATLGQAHALAKTYEPAHEALLEALNVASQLSDPNLEARLLGVRSIVDLSFLRLRESASNGFLSKQLGGSDLPPWQRGLQLLGLHLALVHLGRLEEAARIADELEPLANKIGQSISVACCLSTRAWIEFGKTPDLDKLEAGFQRVSKSEEEASFAYRASVSEVQLSLVNFFRGNWADAVLHAQASCPAETGASLEGSGQGTLFRQMAYAGNRNGALAILDEKRALLPRSGQPNSLGSWRMLALVIEGLVMLGEQSQAAQLYPLSRELVGTGAVTLWVISRFTQTIAGLAAAAAHHWEAAEEHFQTALRQAESLPDVLEQAEIRRFHSMMLLDRAAAGDREKAQPLLREALESYQRIGMPRHVDLTQTLLARVAEM
jgi:tetratricopeptide (TPR) repeat protein